MKAKNKKDGIITSDPTLQCQKGYTRQGMINNLIKQLGWKRSEAEELLNELTDKIKKHEQGQR